MYLSIIIITVLAGVLPPLCRGLVCYDTVVAEEPILIGCDFAGSACAVTNKTTTTEIYGREKTVHETLYHCAERSSSCTSGPLNFCVGEQVTCQTSCCDSNKCNQPEDAKFQVETVPRSEALTCYQLIGQSQKSVECMYKDAMCFYWDIGPRDFGYDSTPQNHTGTQLCSTEKFCQDMKSLCSAYNENVLNFDKQCTATCCSDRHCNPLPSKSRRVEVLAGMRSVYYIGQPHPHTKTVKATHVKGARHTHTAAATKDVFDDDYDNKYPVLDDDSFADSLPHSDDSYSFDTSADYDYSYSNNTGWYVGASAIALFISIVAASVRYSRRTRINVPYRTLQNAQKA